MEALGIKFMLNENVRIERGDASIYVAGVDDAHFLGVDDIDKAAANIPEEAFSILLSHTPEVFRQAARAGFDALLGGTRTGGKSACQAGSLSRWTPRCRAPWGGAPGNMATWPATPVQGRERRSRRCGPIVQRK